MENPTVTIVMITYGHEKYIEEAINGVLMQQCSFPIEMIVSNDCSPDCTDSIIKNLIHALSFRIFQTTLLLSESPTPPLNSSPFLLFENFFLV